MAGTGGSGRKKKSGGAAASRNHAAAANTPTLDSMWSSAKKKKKAKKKANGAGAGGNNDHRSNANPDPSTPTFNPDQAARRMMGQEQKTPQRNQPAAAAAASPAASASALASASASSSPAAQGTPVNSARAAIERARQGGKTGHRQRGSSPSKNSRKRQKSASSSASASASGSPSGGRSPARGGGGARDRSSPTTSTTSPSGGSSKGPTIDLSMDSADEDAGADGDNDDNDDGNSNNSTVAGSSKARAKAKSAVAAAAASKSKSNGGGTKRKNGMAENDNNGNGNDDDDDGFALVIDDDENRINGSEDSTLAKQQRAKQQRAKRSKKGLSNAAAAGTGTRTGSSGTSAGTNTGTSSGRRSEVIDMATSRDEDEDVDVVEVAATSTPTSTSTTGKRKRGGVKSKINGAAKPNETDVVVVASNTGRATASARASASTAAPSSSTAAASAATPAAAAAPVASSPAASNPASVSSQQAQAQPLPQPLRAVTNDTHGLALVRIDLVAQASSPADVDLTPEARDRTAIARFHPLRPKAILGRTGTNPNPQSNKIDLGIGNEADGVSRRQVRVMHISVEGLVVSSGQSNRQRHRPQIRAVVFNPEGASIFVGVAHYAPPRYEMYRAGREFVLNVGDCIVFDAYNGSTTGGTRNDGRTRPAHVFRLVRYDKRDASQAGASPPPAPGPAPALVADTAAVKKRGDKVPITNSAAAAAPVSATAGRTKGTNTLISLPTGSVRAAETKKKDQQQPSEPPPHIPASVISTPRNGKIVDTADIDKTVPRAGIASMVVASMTERQQRTKAGARAKAPENDDDKTASEVAPRAAGSPEASNAVAATATEPSAKKPSRKRQENATKLPPQPSVGDRFCVEFENVKNFFGVLETQWFCGTAEEVSAGNNKYEVNVRFDEGSIGRHVYPADDVKRLVDSKGAGAAPTATASQGRSRRKFQAVDSSQSIERVEAAIYPDGSNSTAVFDPNPSELFVGDLVDCYYQNGKINGAWYRGRVSRVQVSSESGKPTLFDVAYNDQEYEKDIPLEHGNVRLFQRGSDDLSWLYGADLLRSSGRSRNTTKVGIIKSSAAGAASSTPKVVVELVDGTTEEHKYVDIAQEMFATYLQFVPAGKVKVWPTSMVRDAGVRAVKTELAEPNENDEPVATDGDETDDLGATKSKSIARKTNAVTFTSTQLDDMLNDLEQPQDSQQSFPDSPVRGISDKPRAKEMHPSMANALWNALNSAEPSSSAILLRHSAAFHHTLPNSSLSQKTFSLMMTGPQNEGVSFRDPNRMELAYDYMRLSLATSQRLDIGTNISSFAPSSWEDVQRILAQPLKETEHMGSFNSIKESDSISAMRRLGEALQTAASGLSCIDELLKDELSDGKKAGTTSNPRRLYMVNPTVRTALDVNVREALKIAVRHAAQCWVRHGHFVVGDGDDLLPADSADEDWCAMEAKRCLDALGSIVSNLAWLYCAEEGIELSDNDCSFIVSDALRNELETLHQDSADFGVLGKKKPSVASWKKYSKRAKMWFVLSLDKSFASPLQQNLAKMLNLSKDLKLLL